MYGDRMIEIFGVEIMLSVVFFMSLMAILFMIILLITIPKPKQKFIINREALEGMIDLWIDGIDEDLPFSLNTQQFAEIEQIAVIVLMEFMGKMIDYCDYNKRHMTSEEIHAELCKSLDKSLEKITGDEQ